MNIKRLFRKLVGWGLVLLSVFFFGASITLFEKRDYGPFVTGLFFTLVSFALGLQIQTDIEKIRKRMLALMIKCFPKCPICKTDKGYEVRGWLPSSQSVKCKNLWGTVDLSRFCQHQEVKQIGTFGTTRRY